MVRKRYTEEQIIAVLNEAEAGARTADLCRKHGMSDATFYNWKSKYAGPDGKRSQEAQVPGGCLEPASQAWPIRWTTGRSRSCCQKTSKAQGEENSGVIRHGGSWAEQGLSADR